MQAWLRQDIAGGRQVERLVLRVNGTVADAPIKPFPNVVGIDLGPGTAPGSIVAVYTRCTGGLFHERCSIYELDLASGREHRVSALATRRASITEPSVWAGRYAFGRVAIEGRERAGRNFGLYTGVRRAKRLGSRRPGSTDVDANVVAYAGGTSGNRVQHYEIRVHRLRGKTDCLIAKSTERLSAPRNDNTVTHAGPAGGLRLLEPQRQPRHLARAHHARADPRARLQARPGRARDGRSAAGELRLGGRRREGLLLELRRACSRSTCRPSPPPRPGQR